MTTRLVIYAPNGAPVGTADAIDLTGIPNADAAAPMRIVVERQCNMGVWHQIADGPMPLYDPEP